MLELKEISLEDELAFCEFEKRYKKECKDEIIPFSFNPKNLEFKEFLEELRLYKHSKTLPEGKVLANYYLIWVDGRIVGGINFRYQDNDFILNYAGHIGYGVAPWERGNGYAKEALKEALVIAKNMGFFKVLLTTDIDNYASQKVILSCGGKLERIDNNKKFFWIIL